MIIEQIEWGPLEKHRIQGSVSKCAVFALASLLDLFVEGQVDADDMWRYALLHNIANHKGTDTLKLGVLAYKFVGTGVNVIPNVIIPSGARNSHIMNALKQGPMLINKNRHMISVLGYTWKSRSELGERLLGPNIKLLTYDTYTGKQRMVPIGSFGQRSYTHVYRPGAKPRISV